MMKNEKEWKGMKKEKNKENKGMNSEEIVFFDFYIRKNRFSALIFYLSKENEWKNEEFVRKNEEFVRNIFGCNNKKWKIIGL